MANMIDADVWSWDHNDAPCGYFEAELLNQPGLIQKIYKKEDEFCCFTKRYFIASSGEEIDGIAINKWRPLPTIPEVKS